MEPLTVADYEELARERLDPGCWAYYAGGSGDEWTLRENVAAFGRWVLRPRVLVDVAEVSTATTVLGRELSMPLLVAPVAYQRMAHEDGEQGMARAAAAAGTAFCLSTMATATPAEVAAAAPEGVRWFQLYVFKDEGLTREVVAQARDAGFAAIVLTVDTPRFGNREGQVRAGFSVRFAVPALGEIADAELSPQQHFQALISSSLTWRDVERFAELAGLPLVVKGILTAEDARLAVDHGAAAVAVSNHGGRQLDGVPAALDALPEVVEAVEGLVRALQREALDLRLHRHPRREREELLAVAAGQVRDGADDALAPEELVGERGDVAHVDPGADDRPARGDRPQRRRDERADGREQDRGVELLRRLAVGAAGPLGAELARERLRLLVARAGEGEDAPPLRPRDLRDDVRGGPEAVEAEPLRVAREPERAVADQPGAEERRRLQVGVPVRDREAEALVGDRPFRVAAVEVVAGEARPLAEVLPPGAAVAALPARPAEPRHAEPAAVLGLADDLVAGNERQLRPGQLTVHDVQIRPADAAGAHPEEHLPRRGLGHRQLLLAERLARRMQHHRPHVRSLDRGKHG